MKSYLIAFFAMLGVFGAGAQVSVDLGLEQEQFLPNEPIRLTVRVTNASGQQIHLGEDQAWLGFNVESEDGFVVVKNSDVPVVDPFDLESSQMATKRVNLQPYFQVSRPGRYKVTATLSIKNWSLNINSAPLKFEVISGVELWSQDFGVTGATNAPPETRKYVLMKANYLRDQLRLYAEVINADGSRAFKVSPLGPLVAFGSPEAQVDRFSQLHVLWQTGAQIFSYVVLNAEGELVSRDLYDNFNNARPRLTVNQNGDVLVLGGVRRTLPNVTPPAPTPVSSAPAKP